MSLPTQWHPQQLAYIFSLPIHGRNSWCTAQNDAAGLAAERAFEVHLLEKSMLAEAEVAEHALDGNPSCAPQSFGLVPTFAARSC